MSSNMCDGSIKYWKGFWLVLSFIGRGFGWFYLLLEGVLVGSIFYFQNFLAVSLFERAWSAVKDAV